MLSLEDKLYIKLENHWFDVTNYNHPGGRELFKKYHLKDATHEFNAIKGHSDSYVDSLLEEFQVKNPLLVMYLNSIA